MRRDIGSTKIFRELLRPKSKSGKNRGKKQRKRAKAVDFGYLHHLNLLFDTGKRKGVSRTHRDRYFGFRRR